MPETRRCVMHGRRAEVETILGIAVCKPCARAALRAILNQTDEEEPTPQLALVSAETGEPIAEEDATVADVIFGPARAAALAAERSS